jgi:hypothetical protein
MIKYKFKETEFGKMLFLCDNELVGKKLVDKKMKISMKIDENFYENEGSKKEVEKLIKESSFINAIGDESVKIVKKYIKLKKVLYIGGVPHIQVYEI